MLVLNTELAITAQLVQDSFDTKYYNADIVQRRRGSCIAVLQRGCEIQRPSRRHKNRLGK